MAQVEPLPLVPATMMTGTIETDVEQVFMTLPTRSSPMLIDDFGVAGFQRSAHSARHCGEGFACAWPERLASPVVNLR